MLIINTLLFVLILSLAVLLLMAVARRNGRDEKQDSSDWDIVGNEFVIFSDSYDPEAGNEVVHTEVK